jgi:hypothetical protein
LLVFGTAESTWPSSVPSVLQNPWEDVTSISREPRERERPSRSTR